ncbi:MAG: hypothetical protein ACKVGW_01595 [Verrucomicrobiia bacterium]
MRHGGILFTAGQRKNHFWPGTGKYAIDACRFIRPIDRGPTARQYESRLGERIIRQNVHEKILSNLSRIQNLNTINRTSMFAYKNSSKSHTTIAQELGVRYIVEGSARRSEDQIRITIQLIEAQTEKHIWAEQYTRDSKNQFDLEAEIAQEIAQQLNRAMAMN